MRVIAGSAGGIRLAVPKSGVRPTMDRVKAAIFSSLGDTIIGARVLDLFAGSGALGIEALSRGASSVLFVEQDRQFLRRSSGTETFQIIFADPPYEKTESGERFTEKLLTNEALAQLLAPLGVFILEKRPAERFPATKLWNIVRARSYGATEVLFLQGVASPSRPRAAAGTI